MIPFWTIGFVVVVVVVAGVSFYLGHLSTERIWMELYRKLSDRHAIIKLAAETWRSEVEDLAKKIGENEDEQGKGEGG